MDVSFAQSAFPPLALGFFGLGTGYLIWGPQELTNYPARDQSVDRSMGMWGVWLPGFCQFLSGVILFVGLTWFQVFTKSPQLYMAAVAFSAYGIHWFAIGLNRYRSSDARPNAGMCIAFMVISAMGGTVFTHIDDWPVALLFWLLFLVYFFDFFDSFGINLGRRGLGLMHLVTGGWLMYLSFAVAVDFAAGFHWTT